MAQKDDVIQFIHHLFSYNGTTACNVKYIHHCYWVSNVIHAALHSCYQSQQMARQFILPI